jgi:mRNA interferase MazF
MTATLADPARGEIWFAGFDPIVGHEQGGERPCLVVSDDRFNHGRSRLVIVVPISRTDRGLASHVRIDATEGGLKEISFAKCEAVRSISKQRLKSRWGRVSESTLASVEDRLRMLLSL